MDFSGCSRDCGGYFMDFSGFSMDVDGNFWWGVMIQWWFEGDSMVILNIHGDFARSNFEPPTYGKWLWPDRVSVDISRHYVDYWFVGFKAFKSIWILLILKIFLRFSDFFLKYRREMWKRSESGPRRRRLRSSRGQPLWSTWTSGRWFHMAPICLVMSCNEP